LAPANPPKSVIEATRRPVNQLAQGGDDYIDAVANKAEGKNSGERGARSVKPNGHRLGRKT
jgi:hypothetical protein